MSGYESVERALTEGATLVMLCATCPWDRNCVTPPTMTKADVDAQIEEAKRQDREASKEAESLANPVRFDEPIPCGGHLGLWTPAPEVLDRVLEQMGAAA